MLNHVPSLTLYTCRRPYHFTPLEEGSPYDPAKLGFLLLSVRGAFEQDPLTAYAEDNFAIKEEAKSWPLLCQVDQSSGSYF